MAGHAHLKFVMTECSKTQIRLTGLKYQLLCRNLLQIINIWAASWQNQQNECAPSEDSDQLPGHLPSLVRVLAVRMKKAWVLSYPLSAQRRLWSDWVDAQADLSLRWAHMPFCWFCHEVAHLLRRQSTVQSIRQGKEIREPTWIRTCSIHHIDVINGNIATVTGTHKSLKHEIKGRGLGWYRCHSVDPFVPLCSHSKPHWTTKLGTMLVKKQ